MDQVLSMLRSGYVFIHPSLRIFLHCSLQLEQPRTSALRDVKHGYRLGDAGLEHNQVSDLGSSCCKRLATYVTESTGRKIYCVSLRSVSRHDLSADL